MGANLSERRGSILVVALFLTMSVLVVARLCVDLSALAVARQKAQTAADFATISAIRVRARSLEAVAERWMAFGSPISVAGGSLQAPPGAAAAIAGAAESLRRALPGYQGRISSALTVAAEANGADRSLVSQEEPSGLRLGLESRRAGLHEPGLPVVEIDGLWFRRTWPSDAESPRAVVRVGWRVPRLGGTWDVHAQSAGVLAWDADTADPTVAAAGNGGFPADWDSAAAQSPFRPHRYPLYRADFQAALP